MVARSRVVTGALALAVASAAVGCGALIGIEDGVADPGPNGADATTNGDARVDGGAGNDASFLDGSTMPDTSVAPGPIGKPGGDTTTLPCGNASCALPAESCCAYRSSSQPGLYTGVCAATCSPPGPGTDAVDVLHCSTSVNCPAATPRCCLPVSGSPVTTCRMNCFQNEVVLCEPGLFGQCGTRQCGHFTGATMPPSWGYCD